MSCRSEGNIKEITANGTGLPSHHLNKAEHFIGSLVGIALVTVGRTVLGAEILAPELYDLKAALVAEQV